MRVARVLLLSLALAWLPLLGCGDNLRAGADGGGDAGAADASRDAGAEAAAPSDAESLDGDAGALDAAVGEAAPDGTAADAAPPVDGAPDGPLVDCPHYPPADLQDRWTPIEGLAGAPLRATLRDMIDDYTPVTYDEAKLALFGSGGIDVHGGLVECVYTGQTYTPAQLDQTNGFNTEHSWPQSEFPVAAGTVPKGDLHHLFPTNQQANSRRSSLPFGETDCVTTTCVWQLGGAEVGPRIGGTEQVFEVRPPRRGDIARAHFYFAVRYAAAIPAFEEEALRRWHRCDPPDDLERARNDAIEARQGNRNPFIDRPEFVDQIDDY